MGAKARSLAAAQSIEAASERLGSVRVCLRNVDTAEPETVSRTIGHAKDSVRRAPAPRVTTV